jgi:predicted ribosomally synthesized peptide with nif11-like leader
MSRQDAQSFLIRLEEDATLRFAAAKAIETRDDKRLIAVGAANGLTFTASELVHAWRQRRDTAGEELCEEELERAAGGVGGSLPDLRSIVSQIEQNREMKEQVRKAQS